MKKRSYRAQKVNEVRWEEMRDGSPAGFSAQAEEGRERMRRVSRGRLAAETIQAVLESARQTIGVP